jgi:antitoxin HigA-1
MTTKKMPPMHPGEVLREEFLEPLNLTPYALAQALDVPRTRVERVVREETAITADTAHRLSRFFGTTPQFWLNLQNEFDLRRAAAMTGRMFDKIRPFEAKADNDLMEPPAYRPKRA